MGIMDMFGKAIGDTMSAFGKEARTETADLRIDEPVEALVIDTQSGNVQVVAHDDADATHVQVGRTMYMYGEHRPIVADEIDGTRLTLRAAATDSIRTDRVDHVIAVPAGTTVTIRTTAGNVLVSRMRANVDVNSEAGGISIDHVDATVVAKTNAGNVSISDVGGLVTATTQAGSILAVRIAGELTASSSAGSINARELAGLRVVARSQAGKVVVSMDVRPDYVEADASVGAVQVEVPGGAYCLHTKVSLGSQRIDGVTHDPASPNKICASSGAGSVKVLGLMADQPVPG